MIFPHSFYEDEIRSDFQVTSMVKRTWAAQMEILADLDEACRQNGLEYFADWGTLLGAVRHGGFIPWDDDMDICMKRRDYELFTRDISKYLPGDYSIVNFRSNRDFLPMTSRIVSSDHYRFDPEFMRKYSGLPFAMGIDIFPLDFLTDDEAYETDREERAELVYSVIGEIAVYKTPLSSLESSLREIESRCKVSIDREGDVLTLLRELLGAIFGEVEEKDAKFITQYILWMGKHKYRFPKECYSRSVSVPFENTMIEVPAGYLDVLYRDYGTRFMMPVRSGGAHEYPYYEMHLDVLKEHFGFEWPVYSFDPDEFVSNLSDENESGSGEEAGAGKKCLFISYDHRAFDNMRRLVRAYSDEGYEVTVFPVTRFDIAPDMTGIVAGEDVPDDYYREAAKSVSVTHDPDILSTRQDVIVTNYPYDEYNLITTVDNKFYSKSLREHTDRLVYVPPLEMRSMGAGDERAKKLMPSYVCTPMAARCDEIVLHSEEMKDRYVECLCAFSGDEYHDMWARKIRVVPYPEKKSDPDRKADKRKILFYVGIASFVRHGSDAVAKIRRAFDTFKANNADIEMVYITQGGLLQNLKEMYPAIYDEYAANDFYEYTEDITTEELDAYYGEPSMYATELVNEGKPCMIWNVES
ncbi:MAG: LicD family protein [Lachnospiraceae bacterium]|nr:LicD family protein [Lachnospiraceae bacterium]